MGRSGRTATGVHGWVGSSQLATAGSSREGTGCALAVRLRLVQFRAGARPSYSSRPDQFVANT